MSDLVERLWKGVWRGFISNDSVAVLRQGIASQYQTARLAKGETRESGRGPRSRRGLGFKRWSSTVPFAGNWYRLPEPLLTEGLLEETERAKDRVRILLDRYGLLFRELLQWEAPAFQWPRLFRALRLMELSGEVLGGCFFHGIPGLQFISHQAFRRLQHEPLSDAVWWLNACDPASCCGSSLEALKGRLPRRLPGNFVVYRGKEHIASFLRNGKELRFNIPPDDVCFQECLAPIHSLLERRFQPIRRLTVESINEKDAALSEYLDRLDVSLEVERGHKGVTLSKRLR